MSQLYSLVLYLALPFVFLRLLWRSRLAPAYRERWGERLGIYGGRKLRAGFWVHAVSVGEVQAAQPLIDQLLQRYPDAGVLVTTTTPTGAERLRDLFQDRVRHLYLPLDLAPVVNRFLDAVRPRCAIVMETEIWPNLLGACERRAIPVLLANARLSARSKKGYARAGAFTREVLGRFSAIGAQASEDAARFRALGAPAAKVHVTGNIKFDMGRAKGVSGRSLDLLCLWDARRPVWVAASTHGGEEEQVLDAHAQVLERLPQTLLILVPRHPERFARVGQLVERRGFGVTRRSANEACDESTSVFLGDSMGELPVFFAAAHAAFVGGSLVPTGGHNLLEPVALGVPVAIGPHVFNFAEITDLMVRAGAAIQIANSRELARYIIEWLSDAEKRAEVGAKGLSVVQANQGAVDRLLGLVDDILRQ